MALIDSTGNTQGIRFRISPPSDGEQHEDERRGVGCGGDVPARRGSAAAPRPAAPGAAPRKVAAISMGTATVLPPLLSPVAIRTPRTAPARGG